MDGEAIDEAGEGKNPHHLLPRRSQQQITPGATGLPAPARQRCHTTGVDELQARKIHDDPRLASHDRGERSRDTRGVYDVKLPAQRDDNVTVAFAGTQIHAEHIPAFLLGQQGGVSTQRLVSQLPH